MRQRLQSQSIWKVFASDGGSENVGDGRGSSGIQSMTWVHRKLINTANPLDLFQLTVPARTTWDTQLTKASGWVNPPTPPSLPCFITSEPWMRVRFNSWHMCFNNLRAACLMRRRSPLTVLQLLIGASSYWETWLKVSLGQRGVTTRVGNETREGRRVAGRRTGLRSIWSALRGGVRNGSSIFKAQRPFFFL